MKLVNLKDLEGVDRDFYVNPDKVLTIFEDYGVVYVILQGCQTPVDVPNTKTKLQDVVALLTGGS